MCGRCGGGCAAGAGVAGADGDRDWRGRTARGGLLRCGAESRGAGAGRRVRRAGSARRHHCRAVQQHRPDGLGATAITRHRQTRRDVPSPGRRPAERVSAPSDARRDTGKPAPSNDEPSWEGVRAGRGASGAEGASVGDVDRGGRGRQDPPGDRSCGAPGRRVPGRRLVVRTGRGHRSGGGARRGRGGAGASPSSRPRA